MNLNEDIIEFLKNVKGFKYFEDYDVAIVANGETASVYKNDNLILDFNHIDNNYEIYMSNGILGNSDYGFEFKEYGLKSPKLTYHLNDNNELIMWDKRYSYQLNNNLFECKDLVNKSFYVSLDPNTSNKSFGKYDRCEITGEEDIEKKVYDKLLESKRKSTLIVNELDEAVKEVLSKNNIDPELAKINESLHNGYNEFNYLIFTQLKNHCEDYINILNSIEEYYSNYMNVLNNLDKMKNKVENINTLLKECSDIYKDSNVIIRTLKKN